MPTTSRDGTTLYYESHGSGLPLLFSHGYGGTAQMWDHQVAELSRSYQVITWEMRGHARSDSPADPAQYSEAAAVADMAAVLDACGADRAVIVGLALGGYLSLAFRLARPERTRALILVGTGPGYRKDAARDAWNDSVDVIAEGLETGGLDALEKIAWGRHPLHRSATGLALAARGMLAQDDAHIMESLPSIDVPTLVVVGDRDVDFLVPSSYMERKIPDARLVVVEDAGHGCNMDRPEAFNTAVTEFLASVDSGAVRR